MIFSPNLIWLLIALFIYIAFPYDFSSAQKGVSLDWVGPRIAISIGVTFLYTGFWHVALYLLQWGKRPYQKNRKWNLRKVLHNMFFTLLGCLQWSMWECVFIRCYATKRLAYLPNDEIFLSAKNFLIFFGWFFLVPLYRDLHFYFCHRFLHIKVLYTYVHSVHHRNTDPEPFSGLSMHPVEHLYYFSCVAPAIYCFASPFAMLWNGIHLLLSPAAAHSGYEDHFQVSTTSF